MKILVTGSRGYVGAHVAAELIRSGHEVVGVDTRLDGNVIGTHEFHLQSITDPHWTAPIVYDAVVHCAALVSVGESMSAPARYTRVNVIGTDNLLQRLSFNHFVHVSTVTAEEPQNPYALSKRLAEHVVETGSAAPWAILRLSNVAGAAWRMKQVGAPTHLVRVAARCALDNKTLTVCGTDLQTRDGTCERDYVHVCDVSEAVAAAVHRRAEGYHSIHSGVYHSNLEVVNKMREVSGVSFPVVAGPPRPGDPAIVRINRARSELCPVTPRPLQLMCRSALDSEMNS